jgi:hypothetical protein
MSSEGGKVREIWILRTVLEFDGLIELYLFFKRVFVLENVMESGESS